MARDPDPPVSVEVAAEALEYWLRRLRKLPHRKRAERREARAMIARWERRHRAAVKRRRSASLLGRAVVAVGAEFLLAPPRAPGGPLARARRERADTALRREEAQRAREAVARARKARRSDRRRRGAARLRRGR